MGMLIGIIFGSALAMLVGGYLAAWVIRKISGIANVPSYAIGVLLMTFVGAWSITFDGSPSFFENWAQYAIGAAIALPLMIIGDRRKQRQEA